MKEDAVLLRSSLIVIYFFLFLNLLFAQSKLELIVPEGISQERISILKSNDQTQFVLNEEDSNNIIVWSLLEGRQIYQTKLSSAVNSLSYDSSGKYIYASTKDNKIYILDAKNGEIISQRMGYNYVRVGFSPFIADHYLYMRDNQAYLSHIFSEQDRKISISQEDLYLNSVNYDLESQKLLLFTGDGGIYIYDKDLQPYGRKRIDYAIADYYIIDNKLISYNSNSGAEFKVFDLRTGELLNEIELQQEAYSVFYDKTKKYIAHYKSRLFLYENDNIIVKDIVTGKTIKTIALRFKTVDDIVLSEDNTSLLVYGNVPYVDEYGYDATIKDIHIYDLKDYSIKEIVQPDENRDDSSSSNSALFDEENFFLYRFSENQVLKNSIITGALEKSFRTEKGKKIATYPISPTMVNNRFILISLENENNERSIACIDGKSNQLVWTFDGEIETTGKVTINEQLEVLTIANESYPNNIYTILDIATGRTLFQKESAERMIIYPVGKDKILKLSSYDSGDWNNPVRELHIYEYTIQDNQEALYEIPVEGGGYVDDVLFKDQYLYVKYNNRLLTFKSDDLSQIADSVHLEMGDCRLIDIVDNRFLYINSITPDKKFTAYSLSERKELLEQESLSFIGYIKPLRRILLKNETSDLLFFNVDNQELLPAAINLSQVDLYRDFNVFHDRWLVYKKDKKVILYDLENHRVKHLIGNLSRVESVSRDGNLYYEFGKIKYAQSDVDFVSLANSFAIPQSMSDISFTTKPYSITHVDENGLLNILNLSENQINTFQFLTSAKSYEKKYRRLSPNLFLASSDKEHQILNVSNNKIINLSDKTTKIENIEVENELLIMTGGNKLRVFNLNNAEQLFEAEAFHYRKLNDNLIIYQDREGINLYSVKRNGVIWETKYPNYIGSGLFSSISGNTIFTTLGRNEIGALDLRTGEIKSQHTLSSNIFTIGKLFGIEPLTIQAKNNYLYVNVGGLSETKYQIFQYKEGEFIEVNMSTDETFDIPKLKATYKIDESDNFSLNDNILAVFNYSAKQFSLYDIQSDAILYEQNVDISDLTWQVLEDESTIFIYNNSGDVLLVDYGNHKSYKHKINGNKFIINNNRLFVSDYWKKIDVYDFENIEKLTKLYSLIPMSGEEYMFYTEDGYYLSTKAAAKDIQFKLGNDLYSFEQFDLIYNRPDIVLKAMSSTNSDLINMYEKAYHKRLTRQDYTVMTSKDLMPDIEVANKNKSSQSDYDFFKMEINANGKADKLSKIVIKVNDNLYKEIAVEENTFNSVETIALNQGSNNIEVYALNSKNVKSISDKTEVYYTKGEVKTPKVYFFGIGVSNYENDDFDLKYSSKDVRDMAKVLSGRYPNIDISLLLDSEVTIENINGLKQKLSQIQTDDIVIFSFCGHGVLDKDYNWYFATHDLDFTNPKKRGFSYDNLISLTQDIKSRQKLVTIDACHSGEVDTDDIDTENLNINHQHDEKEGGQVVVTKRGAEAVEISKNRETTSFALMKQMFSDLESSNGTVVISASGGLEYAFEGGAYQNGAFTYSILSLLYNSVWNTLKISELQKAVMEKVYKLTDGNQQPNVRTGTLNYDWVVW